MWCGPVYDCQKCGACCVKPSYLDGSHYVYLTRNESKRMKRLGLSVVCESGDAHLGTRASAGAGEDAICVAFRGAVGGGCGCSIYAERPHECRKFQVGSSGCRSARREAGLAV